MSPAELVAYCQAFGARFELRPFDPRDLSKGWRATVTLAAGDKYDSTAGTAAGALHLVTLILPAGGES